MSDYKAGDPTPVIVRAITVTDGTGTFVSEKVVRVPIAVSTLTAATNWVNPETGTIMANVSVVLTAAGGSGTFDVGTSTDGTGANAAIIDGGVITVTKVITAGTVASTATIGNPSDWFMVAGSGTAGDSVVMIHSDATGTFSGFLVIRYVPLT